MYQSYESRAERGARHLNAQPFTDTMYQQSTIPPEHEAAILAKASEGLSTRAISAWLLKEHGVSCSHGAIGRFFRSVREGRSDTAKTVVREKLATHLTTDLDRLEWCAARCFDIVQSTTDTRVLFPAMEQLRKITDTKLKYSGAGVPDEEPVSLDDASIAALQADVYGAARDKPTGSER